MRYCHIALQDFVQSFSPFSPAQGELKEFGQYVESYLSGIADSKNESEEHQKNLLRDFLNQSFGYDCNTKDRIDLAIYDDSVPKVLFEVKKRDNAQEFVKPNVKNPNLECKAFYESILYFLRETITNKNNNLTHIVLTNTKDFYLIDAKDYVAFAKDKAIVKAFKNCEHKKGNDTSTKRFYEELKNLLPTLDMEIQYTYFRIENSILASCHSKSPCYFEPALAGEESHHVKSKRDVWALPQHDKIPPPNNKDISINAQHDNPACHSKASAEESHHILPLLYQVLSPHVLLKRKTYLDANTLNQDFYNELLYILGLKESSQNGKVLILPSLASNTLLDLICSTFGLERDKDFETLFSLLTTWNNRLLFLRLLESMLLSFKHIKKPFLNLDCLKDFQTLNTLFFDVLAKEEESRDNHLPKALSSIPYLNSSLFEKTALEKEGKEIKLLESKPLILHHDSILYKDKNFCQSLNLNAQAKDSTLPLLEYLFAFLHAYDFTTTAQDIQNHTKMNFDKLINSAVLGLVFEKLNGYQEGSFYTPSFITHYMCKQSLERVVLQKFNESLQWDCQNLEELKNKIDKLTDNKEGYKQANAIFDSIHICDPAVGSGHFLVSALNELILLKFKLGILCDENNNRIKDITLEILRDEIVIRDSHNALFTYTLPAHDNIEYHKIQRALFFAKRKLIESCLFGVDINPNSCEITKLRLWIELLKYSYYKDIPNKRLETLPNIDINIKCGNSLISRFNLSDSLRTIPNINFQIEQYKKLVFEYKNADQSLMTISKKDIEKQIETIQATFTLTLKDPKTKKELEKAIESHIKQFNNYLLDDESLLEGLGSLQFNLFGTPTLSKEEQERALESYGKIQALRKKLTLALSGAEYKNAFEWRFAFPEVLDSNGDFLGFDLVIGNPPYIDYREISSVTIKCTKHYAINTKSRRPNIFCYFIERGIEVANKQGILSFINPIAMLQSDFAYGTRKLLLEKGCINYIADCSFIKVFDSASTYTMVWDFKKNKEQNSIPIILYNNDNFVYSHDIKSYADNDMFSINILKNCFSLKIEYNKLSDLGILKWGTSLSGYGKLKIKLQDLQKLAINQQKHYARIIQTADIKRYSIIWKEEYIPIEIYSESIQTDFLKDKLVVARMTKKLQASFDKNKFYMGKATLIVDLQLNPLYILGILNSKLIDFWYKYHFGSTHLAGGYIRYDITYLRRIPIPKITKSNQKIVDRIIALVDDILESKAKDSTTDTNNLESEIDKLVYELYNLSNEEINIIENKEQK